VGTEACVSYAAVVGGGAVSGRVQHILCGRLDWDLPIFCVFL
jgi:hypothetical protein